jgi:hypothetical protein
VITSLWYTCTMPLMRRAGTIVSDKRFGEELEYLYKRLATVNNLIRTLEEYDQNRPRPAQLQIRVEKTA